MVILKKGEEIIAEESVKMIIGGMTEGKGTLILTNARIIYEIRSGGAIDSLLGTNTQETSLNASLGEVINVTDTEPIIPIPLVTKKVVRIEFQGQNYEFAVKDSKWWRAAIINTSRRFQDWHENLKAKKQKHKALARERRLQEERNYRLELEKAKGEGAAQIAKAGTSESTTVTHYHGDFKTEIKDSVVQRSKIGGESGRPPPAAGDDESCPHCDSPIQRGWKACPACGNKLSLKCPNCGSGIQRGWKACPACGEQF